MSETNEGDDVPIGVRRRGRSPRRSTGTPPCTRSRSPSPSVPVTVTVDGTPTLRTVPFEDVAAADRETIGTQRSRTYEQMYGLAQDDRLHMGVVHVTGASDTVMFVYWMRTSAGKSIMMVLRKPLSRVTAAVATYNVAKDPVLTLAHPKDPREVTPYHFAYVLYRAARHRPMKRKLAGDIEQWCMSEHSDRNPLAPLVAVFVTDEPLTLRRVQELCDSDFD